MAWTPMTREEAKQVIADSPQPMHLVTPMSLERGARLREAQLVLGGHEPDDIYEALTDFLGRRPDAPLPAE
jgi:hypothetical protein